MRTRATHAKFEVSTFADSGQGSGPTTMWEGKKLRAGYAKRV